LVFSKSNGKFLWVPILEKAYAKAYGSYYALEAGNIDEAIRDLTGAPSFSFDLTEKSEDDLWQIIKRSLENKFVLSCAVDIDEEEESDRYEDDYGIITEHAYTLIQAIEV
jgi:calpain-15